MSSQVRTPRRWSPYPFSGPVPHNSATAYLRATRYAAPRRDSSNPSHHQRPYAGFEFVFLEPDVLAASPTCWQSSPLAVRGQRSGRLLPSPPAVPPVAPADAARCFSALAAVQPADLPPALTMAIPYTVPTTLRFPGRRPPRRLPLPLPRATRRPFLMIISTGRRLLPTGPVLSYRGAYIAVNPSRIGPSDARMRYVVAHEVGHALAFVRTGNTSKFSADA